ncbi:hypothetical protein PoB_005054300 [Plakobranchus ocellatus]|uniref:Uncharacterized protein n=1 Tax=Plakobranchus ocellatus TaxID=259542 RepID=A0AAV4BWM9_9GAST|nr:hypothetical protein PoB_005054300 [Plakobranchus ocellatus]
MPQPSSMPHTTTTTINVTHSTTINATHTTIITIINAIHITTTLSTMPHTTTITTNSYTPPPPPPTPRILPNVNDVKYGIKHTKEITTTSMTTNRILHL